MLKIKSHARAQNSLWKALITGNNARSPVIIQRRSCLGLITVSVPSSSIPTVVWVPSKQLPILALYLLAVREEIGPSAGNFLTAVACQCRGSTPDRATVEDCGGAVLNQAACLT